MVFGFAKQSGGGVVVDGEDGKGACFRIYLPKADVEPSDAFPASDASPPDDDELRGGSETILCVEDDDVVRAHVTGRLESLGYKVITASNAAKRSNWSIPAGVRSSLHRHRHARRHERPQLAQKVAELRRPLRVLYTSGHTFGAFDSSGRLGYGVLLLTKPYRKAELARMVRLCLDRAIDHMGDPIPLPYSVQEDLERSCGKIHRRRSDGPGCGVAVWQSATTATLALVDARQLHEDRELRAP